MGGGPTHQLARIRLDTESIGHAQAIIDTVTDQLSARVRKITGYALTSTASRAKTLSGSLARVTP